MRLSVEFERTRVELIVFAFLRKQFLVIAAFDYFAVFEHQNDVGVSYRGKAVRYDKDRSAAHKPVHTLFDNLFGAGVD